MRTLKIFALGVVGLAAAFLLSFIQDYTLFAMALTPLILLLIGQFYLPRSNRAIRVWFNPIVVELDGELMSVEPGTPVGRLSGRELAFSHFKQWHDFRIVTHRFWLLAGIGLLSLEAASAVWKAKDILFDGVGLFYSAGSIWLMVVWLGWRWVWERRVLRCKGLSIGDFSVTTNTKPPYRSIRYHFVDPEGEYRGGIFDSMVCDQADDMTIIFYDEDNPDRSVPASALMFHKLVWNQAQPRSSSSAAKAG